MKLGLSSCKASPCHKTPNWLLSSITTQLQLLLLLSLAQPMHCLLLQCSSAHLACHHLLPTIAAQQPCCIH